VTGGFHLVNATEEEVLEISAKLKQLGVKKLAPSHCTGREATEVFKEKWKEDYIRLYLGHTYHF
ncbi:MAG: MBL fold metallo-hydrolase, partial [bacterium]